MLISICHDHLEALGQKTGETAHLAVREGRQVLFIDHHASTKQIVVPAQTGALMPLHCTAHGKALLCRLRPRGAPARCSARRTLKSFTEHTIVSLPQLEKACAKVRADGYATDEAEYLDEVRCVAAPIRDQDRQESLLPSASRPRPRAFPRHDSAPSRAMSETPQPRSVPPCTSIRSDRGTACQPQAPGLSRLGAGGWSRARNAADRLTFYREHGTNMGTLTRRDFTRTSIALGVTTALGSMRVLGANDRVAMGLIGCGGRGSQVADRFLKMPDASVVAVADVYEPFRERALAAVKAGTFTRTPAAATAGGAERGRRRGRDQLGRERRGGRPQGLPTAARPQGRRRRHHRHAGSLARADGRRGAARRQGRLRREAAVARAARGPRHRGRGAPARSASARSAASSARARTTSRRCS